MENILAKLTDIANERTDILQSLTGILPPDISLEEERKKRLIKRYEDRD